MASESPDDKEECMSFGSHQSSWLVSPHTGNLGAEPSKLRPTYKEEGVKALPQLRQMLELFFKHFSLLNIHNQLFKASVLPGINK